MRRTISEITAKKQRGEKISMLTAYDCAFAPLLEEAGVDFILVGDSMANVMLGYEYTKEISLEEMINHTRAVVKATNTAPVIGDLPYCSCQFINEIINKKPAEKESALRLVGDNAERFMTEAGCQAVKIEWFEHTIEASEAIIKRGIPLMGHIGYTPQMAESLGKSVVQGKTLEAAEKLLEQALAFERLGCFSIVLECVPRQVARIITERLSIPTIGIGAGPYCDGQVLVLHDLLGLIHGGFRPKFVRRYADLSELAGKAIKQYVHDIKRGDFPSQEESFSLPSGEGEKIKNRLEKHSAGQ